MTANWTGNTITVKWYNDDTQYDSNSCTYGGDLTMPSSIPQKTGYTFKGWRVKQAAQCSFTASEVNGMSGVNWSSTPLDGIAGSNEAQYGLTTPGEWAIEFNTGIIKGMAKCSSTSGDWATPGTPSDTNGRYCWCRATNYTPNRGNQCNVASPSWVFYDVGYESASDCAGGCAYICSLYVMDDIDLRRAVFGVAQ